jgi:flagellar basal-body rod modification protein FlgD
MTSPLSGVMSSYATGSSNQTDQANQASNGSASSSSAADALALDPQAFLQLLVTQLQYQDPTNPVDTSTFLNQTATLSQVQTMNTMGQTLTSLLSAQQAQSATAMIGKQVTYTGADGNTAQGVVTAAQLFSTGATLQVGDATVPLSSVTEVTAASTS